MTRVLLPLVNGILKRLGLRPRSFDIALIPIDAVGAIGLRTQVSGHSADTAAFRAMLSAATRLPLRQDVVTTGKIDSMAGEIGLVEGISAKLAAAAADRRVREFFLPQPETDRSLATFSPREFNRIAAAMAAAKENLLVTEVADVAALLAATTTPGACALAALKSGYYDRRAESEDSDDPIDRAAHFLCDDHNQRFQSALRAHTVTGRMRQAKRVLATFATYHVEHGKYPRLLGSDLQSLVAGVPSPIRRRPSFFPLLPLELCARLGELATEGDIADYQILRDIVSGMNTASSGNGADAGGRTTEEPNGIEALVQAVFAEISAENLARRIGLSIDTARAAYSLHTVILVSADDVNDCVASFYVYLLCRDGRSLSPAQLEAAKDDAQALLDRAFADEGSADAAIAEARYGTRGGMRFVLDVLTERFKNEAQADHVACVLREALNPFHLAARTAFMEALLRRVRPQLPEELREEPPGRFIRRLDALAQAYVRSLDRFAEVARSL
ncbi:MAG: hypothetical protein KAV82_01455 [Phycisphaerae bacterium]|nr:hypothetical protein [Phycisphaerae bacterium]